MKRHMKRADEAREAVLRPAPRFTMQDLARTADVAVREAVARHKALSQDIVVWRDGEVVWLKPEEIRV